MRRTDLRKKIIKSAIKLFAKKGFYETTVEDIANAAKVAKGTVYLYFKDKPSLYISIIEEHLAAGITYLKEVQNEDLTSTEKLQSIADEWTDYMLQFKSSFPMFTLENINLTRGIMRALEPIVFSRFREMTVLVAQIIDDGIKKKEFRRVDPTAAALHFLNTIRTGFFVRSFIPGASEDKHRTIDLFFNGLRRRR